MKYAVWGKQTEGERWWRKNIIRRLFSSTQVSHVNNKLTKPHLVKYSFIQYTALENNAKDFSTYIVYNTVGCSDYYLVWMELGRTTKTTRKAKHVIRKWCLERFENEEVKLKYQNAVGVSETFPGGACPQTPLGM